MKWWMIALPVGALGAYLLLRPSDQERREEARTKPPPPPPGEPVATAGGPRARRYEEQIDMALEAYNIASSVPFFGGTAKTTARTVALETIKTVVSMAEKDVQQKAIADADLRRIREKAEQAEDYIRYDLPIMT